MKLPRSSAAFVTTFGLLLAVLSPAAATPAGATYAYSNKPIDCSNNKSLCAEVYGAQEVFGHYVGHDEPSVLFYSNKAGAGNRDQWTMILPSDPSPALPNGDATPNNKSWNFQLHPAFWFGMAMCDTQSYPEVTTTCKPDSDTNITPLAQHAGTAFMELQFYPPGWVLWPAGNSCDPTKWCAALNVDSLSEDPINGNDLNAACQGSITGGVEYINFAFVSKNGSTAGNGPAGPLNSTLGSFTPNASDLFMNSGDRIQTTMSDTDNGLKIVIKDLTTDQQGSMTASPANGFAQMRFAPPLSSGDPRAGTDCTEIPYAFHPMYSTSSPATRVPWAAHSYNVAFSDEIGHFDYCTGPINLNSAITPCTPNHTTEGITGDTANTEGISRSANATADDYFCFPAAASTLVQVQGCIASNNGFDGVPYQNLWPGSGPNRAGPFFFSSPLTGEDYNTNYQQAALETDLPRVERDTRQHCDVFSGARCTYLPVTDDGQAAVFYPIYSVGSLSSNGGGDSARTANGNENGNNNGNCWWSEGTASIPGLSNTNAFGGTQQQYGPLFPQTYLISGGGGATEVRIDDFHNNLNGNPCPAAVSGD